MDDVKQFFQENVEQKKQLKGYNSFIAPYPKYEYQLDLFFINDVDEQNFKIGMIMIDIFTKFMVVVPLKSKTEGDVAAGLMESILKMGGKPEIIYTDDEGSLGTEAMKKYFQDESIKHVITRGHAWFAERGIRTFKDALYKRIDNSEKENEQWPDFIYEILLTYNNKLKHSSTGFTPEEARKSKNEINVRMNLLVGKKHNRIYPELKEHDKVRIYRKKKKGEKERTSTWSENSYEIEAINTTHGQNYFKLVGLTKEYLRNELLKNS